MPRKDVAGFAAILILVIAVMSRTNAGDSPQFLVLRHQIPCFVELAPATWSKTSRRTIAQLMQRGLRSLDVEARSRLLSGLVSGAVSSEDFLKFTSDHWRDLSDEEQCEFLYLIVVHQLQGTIAKTYQTPDAVLADRFSSLPKALRRVVAVRVLCIESQGGLPICLQARVPPIPPLLLAEIYKCYLSHAGDPTFISAVIAHATTSVDRVDWSSPQFDLLVADISASRWLSPNDLSPTQYLSLPTNQALVLCASQDRNRPLRAAASELILSGNSGREILAYLGWSSLHQRPGTQQLPERLTFPAPVEYMLYRCVRSKWAAIREREPALYSVLEFHAKVDDRRPWGQARQFCQTSTFPNQPAVVELQPLWQLRALNGDWTGHVPVGVYISSAYLSMGSPVAEDPSTAKFLHQMFEDAMMSSWVGFAAATAHASQSPQHRESIKKLVRQSIGDHDKTPFLFASDCLRVLDEQTE